ncbi:MAG: hypothetical protein NTV49_15070 [Kiritimatiellaeota bacterium]|nr:hypothetical protein [Kiritimatiellota bacterium]
MKTTRETKWKVAAAVLVFGLAALAMQTWRTHSGVRYYEELARRGVVRSDFAVPSISVPCLWSAGLI